MLPGSSVPRRRQGSGAGLPRPSKPSSSPSAPARGPPTPPRPPPAVPLLRPLAGGEILSSAESRRAGTTRAERRAPRREWRGRAPDGDLCPLAAGAGCAGPPRSPASARLHPSSLLSARPPARLAAVPEPRPGCQCGRRSGLPLAGRADTTSTARGLPSLSSVSGLRPSLLHPVPRLFSSVLKSSEEKCGWI